MSTAGLAPPGERRRRLRHLLQGQSCDLAASTFDPISARMAQSLGYQLGILGGSVASMQVLGAPDINLLTASELAEQVRRICHASDLPLLVDGDHGYGNALSVMRTVRDLEGAGAAAITIEDTLLPARFDQPASALVSIEEGMGKIRAALAARQDPSLVIVARSSAFAMGGAGDGLRRMQAYAAAGADALFVVGAAERDLAALHVTTRLPLVHGTAADEVDARTLATLGARVLVRGHHAFFAGLQAIHDTLLRLRDGARVDQLGNQPSPALLAQFTMQAEYEAQARDFLRPPAA